jgi:hypothetical protein
VAIPTDTVFEVQPGVGSDTTCSGGFSAQNKGATGVDYSVAGSAHTTFTSDLSGVGTTTLTSAGSHFDNTMLGNLIQITGQGTYCITAFGSAASVTVDRSLGTFSATTGYLGGAFASIGMAGSLAVVGSGAAVNGIYLKNTGTANGCSTSLNVAGGRLQMPGGTTTSQAFLIGYTSNRTFFNADAKPTIQPSANSVQPCVKTETDHAFIRNIAFANPGAFTGCWGVQNDDNYSTLGECTFDSLNTGVNGTFGVHHIYGCYASNCNAPFVLTSNTRIVSCFVSGGGDGTVFGIKTQNTSAVIDCIVTGYSGVGISVGNASIIDRCTVNGCTGANGNGVQVDGLDVLASNTISYGNSQFGFAISSTGAESAAQLLNCAGGANTSGNTDTNFAAVPTSIQGFITLTATPFTAAGSGDFSLNNTAGGGALLQAAAYPGVFPGGTTTSYSDVGAAQHPAAAGGGLLVNPLGWR